MMNSKNFQTFMLPIIRDTFEKHIGKLKDFVPVIYNVATSKRAQEINHGIGSLGLMKEWNESNGQVYYDQVRRGFKQTYTHKKYSIGLPLERELVEDVVYDEVKNQSKKLADSVYYSRQLHAVQPFNECTTMIGPDGKPLCATDHPLGPFNPTTWSNFSSEKPLTPDNVERVRNEMMEWVDDRGNKILINPDMIVVPKELRKTAKIIADTDNEPFTTDYGINIWKGALDVLEWDFLNKANMWFLVDKNRMKHYLKWYERRKAQVEKDRENFDSEVIRYKAVCRYSFGWDEPSFIYGCRTN